MKTKSVIGFWLIIIAVLMIIAFPLFCGAAQREISEAWKVDVGQKQKQALKFFQAESVQLTETFTQNGRPVDLSGTNTVVVWEINGWGDYTNTYAIATGTVSSASNVVTFSLTPAAANLPASNYLGFVRALQSDGTNLSQVAVLAYQTIAVEWSPDSRNYAMRGPFTQPIYYTTNVIIGPQGPAGSNDVGRIVSLESRTNDWNTAFSWGDHAGLYPLLATYAGATQSLWTAIANATPGGYASVSNWAATAYGWSNHALAGYANQSDLSAVSNKVTNLESGVEDFEALNLGGTVIDDYSDIGLTYTNAVRLNAAVMITNDSQWTGWTTTGTLDPVTHAIFLGATNQYLISPVQTNGIAYFSYSISSHLNGTTYEAVIWTNGALASTTTPWRYPNGQVYFRPINTLPGASLGITISNVTVTAYTDLTEAQTPKEVSNLRVVEEPSDATDVANKRYVDSAEADANAYSAAQLSAYAADKTKTLRGAELRLGNMWVVSPADTSGERFIVSGGEISGNGELIGTTNEFIIAKNDYPLMSFKSDASGLHISNFTVSATASNLVWTLRIATNGVHSTPFAEWTDTLIVGEWSRVLTCQTNTYPVASNGTYTLTFCVPTNRTCFVRAMQQEGSSVAKVLTDVFDVGGAAVTGVSTLTTTGGVEIVSTVQALETNAMLKTVYDTDGDGVVESARSADNATDAAYATAANTAGYSDNSGALGGQPPTHYLPANAARKQNLQGPFYVSAATITTIPTYTANGSYAAIRYTTPASYPLVGYVAPFGSTNFSIPFLFGRMDLPIATNSAVRIQCLYSTVNSSTGRQRLTVLDNTSVVSTNGYVAGGTNNFFYINFSIPSNHWNEAGGYLSVFCASPTTGITNSITNSIYGGVISADVLLTP